MAVALAESATRSNDTDRWPIHHRVHLEVQVRPVRVAGVPDVADERAGVDDLTLIRLARVLRKVRVVVRRATLALSQRPVPPAVTSWSA